MSKEELIPFIKLSGDTITSDMASRADQVQVPDDAITPHEAVLELDRQIDENPDDPVLYLKKGIALSRATLHHQQAIDAFSYGLMLDPFNAMLYRWRGHKLLNVRRINAAIADLELAGRLDPDNWDIWYHLGLGHYLNRDYTRAARAYAKCLALTAPGNINSLVAVVDWYYMTLRRAGRDQEAAELLEVVPVVPINEAEALGITNDSYLQRIHVYKGLASPDTLLEGVSQDGIELVTLGYGVGNYYFYTGDEAKAHEIWNQVLEGGYWSALGYLATEVEMGRTRP
ncbi:MAG: hypothetical protein M9953_09240 [Thermomicrobiales bacterium]|nr:hypothetical protein [Thermomicrobiales bacterium]MCO5228206.1 hypothetical protein [Thermomicrobiales bacterium]